MITRRERGLLPYCSEPLRFHSGKWKLAITLTEKLLWEIEELPCHKGNPKVTLIITAGSEAAPAPRAGVAKRRGWMISTKSSGDWSNGAEFQI
jgi:hypothetical protein